MGRTFFRHFVFCCILSSLPAALGFYEGLVNADVNRKIDLTTQLTKVDVKIALNNSGSQDATSFLLAFSTSTESHLSYLSVEDAVGNYLTVAKASDETAPSGFVFYRVGLNKTLKPELKVSVALYAVFTHRMVPYPAEITQSENHLVKFTDNHYFLSPYRTKKQKTTIKLSTDNDDTTTMTEFPPTDKKKGEITYGPYSEIAPYTLSPMELHFENNRPFLAVTKLLKEIEVSHWGNIAVEEVYKMRNAAAKLKGSFSRYDYQFSGGPSAIKEVTGLLPETATDIYYRDSIGNISTSNVLPTEKGVQIEMRPRFPLFGGWKTEFCFGYNLPIENYVRVFRTSGAFALRVPFSTHYDGVVVDDIAVKVILPEGARDIEVSVPFPVDAIEHGTYFGTLDFVGRPTVIIRKSNLVPEHTVDFQVTYRVSSLHLLRKPVLVSIGLLLLTAAVMAYVRMDVSISKEEKDGKQAAARVFELLVSFQANEKRRAEAYKTLDAQHAQFVLGKRPAFADDTKRVKDLNKECNDKLQDIIKDMKLWDAAKVAKMTEVATATQERHNTVFAYYTADLKASAPKPSKDVLTERHSKVEVIETEIQDLVRDLTDDL